MSVLSVVPSCLSKASLAAAFSEGGGAFWRPSPDDPRRAGVLTVERIVRDLRLDLRRDLRRVLRRRVTRTVARVRRVFRRDFRRDLLRDLLRDLRMFTFYSVDA